MTKFNFILSFNKDGHHGSISMISNIQVIDYCQLEHWVLQCIFKNKHLLGSQFVQFTLVLSTHLYVDVFSFLYNPIQA